jgi:rubrerythrin
MKSKRGTKMEKEELIAGIRLDLQKEQDAIITYTGQVSRTDNEAAKKVLTSIANEERVHVGELMRLLEILSNEEKYLDDGEEEVKKTLRVRVAHKKPARKSKKRTGRRTTSRLSVGR